MSSDWTLALQQETDLTVTHGSVEKVADFMRRGSNLRLYMTTERYEETLYFQQTYAGEDGQFAGIMSHHHSYEVPDQPSINFFRYDTSGGLCQLRWKVSGELVNESQNYPYGEYRWYVRDSWRLVYEHDETGQRLSGDLEELKEAVRQGKTIQVGLRQLFGLSEDDSTGPRHISFLPTMQPLIMDDHVLANCDLAVIASPEWSISWDAGIHIAFMRPSTSGEIECFLSKPGSLSFNKIRPNRAMEWYVARDE